MSFRGCNDLRGRRTRIIKETIVDDNIIMAQWPIEFEIIRLIIE